MANQSTLLQRFAVGTGGTIFLWTVLIGWGIAAIVAFIVACYTKGNPLSLAVFFAGTLLAYMAFLVIRNQQKAKKVMPQKQTHPTGHCWQDSNSRSMILDARICSEGMTCEEYTLLIIAGPYSDKLPMSVREKMNRHLDACGYHSSKTFRQSALGTPVTEILEQEAMKIVEKYSH